MEISSGTVLRRTTIISGAGFCRGAKEPTFSDPSITRAGRSGRMISAWPRGYPEIGRRFSNEGHLQYYLTQLRCGGRKEEKKRAKLMKGLSKDLHAFYSLGYGIETGDLMVGESKRKMINEAAELLSEQLKQLRADKKELKRRRKQEKAARMKVLADNDTSSDSSDSDCEAVGRKPDSSELTTEALICNQVPVSLELKLEGENSTSLKSGLECSSSSSSSCKIEVCMGWKCKRSGALELLEEFKKAAGFKGAVVGCKCMGKCRDGPNARVLNHRDEEGYSHGTSRNPLCIGVGLEDVGAIVANFFGEKKNGSLLDA